MNLPVARVTQPIPSAAYPVFINAQGAFVGLPARHVARLPTDADGDLAFEVALERAVLGRPCKAGLKPLAAVYIDATLSSGFLADALKALGDSGYGSLYVAVRSPGEPRGANIGLLTRPQGNGPVRLLVTARPDGFWLRAAGSGGFVLTRPCPGQVTAPADAPTVQATPARFELEALRRCVDAITPAGATLELSVDGRLSVQTAIASAETLAAGHPLEVAGPTPQALLTPRARASAAGTVPDANRVVYGMRSDFRACYNAELARNPGIRGSIRLRIKVGADGNVTAVNAQATGDLGKTVVVATQIIRRHGSPGHAARR